MIAIIFAKAMIAIISPDMIAIKLFLQLDPLPAARHISFP
jgi:hypothetical protein